MLLMLRDVVVLGEVMGNVWVGLIPAGDPKGAFDSARYSVSAFESTGGVRITSRVVGDGMPCHSMESFQGFLMDRLGLDLSNRYVEIRAAAFDDLLDEYYNREF